MAKNSFVAEVVFNNLPDYVICNILLPMLDDTTLYSRCYHASDL